MEKRVTILASFEEADRAEKAYYQSLSPQERLDILLELNRRWPVRNNGDAADRLQRVYRIVKMDALS